MSIFLSPVATGFPTGQTSLRVRLEEIKDAIAAGATEIDIVINRRHAIRYGLMKVSSVPLCRKSLRQLGF